jgi:hypothetical protein
MPIRGSIANSLKSFGADRIGGIPAAITGTIDYVMAAGGGGGGFNGGGGGGGGGVLFGSGYPVGPGITLTMGVGGGGGGGNGGSPSTITGPGTPSLTAIGGGDGGDGNGGKGGDGGSGGGGARDQSGPAPSNPTSFGLGTPGQGNRGGRGGTPPQGAAGGGGGANGGGQDGSPNPSGSYDNARNGGDGKSPIFDLGWPDIRTYLNAQGIQGGGSWTAPNGVWEDYRLGSGGGNGVDGGPGSNIGLGGSGPSWRGYPHTGGDGGTDSFNGGASRNANSATQYTGSGGGGGAVNPGGGSSPNGASGSGGTIIIKYDEYFANAASVSGALYARQSGYRIFHWLGTGTITF